MDRLRRQTQLSRIGEVLDYVHLNLDKPMAVSSLATIAGWSRWQFNRVFSEQIGQSVGQYVRELKLSLAAEMMLFTDQKIIDIGLACGFGSDISFSRSFKQHFGCPPAQYRRRGLPCLLSTPLCLDPSLVPSESLQARIPNIRLDARPSFTVEGQAGRVHGLFSPKPDFNTMVPNLWRKLSKSANFAADQPRIGVLDLTRSPGSGFTYLAGIENDKESASNRLSTVTIPAQNYAVVSFRGPMASLAAILEWFFDTWLPHANCKPLYGYDLEIYPAGFDSLAPEVAMEYWVPVTLSEPLISRYAPIG